MNVDLIIENGLLVTMNPGRDVISNGAVVINKGKIIDVGDVSILQKYQASKKINSTDMLIMPGLVNSHVHTGNTVYRGIADDMPLKKWLTEFIFPLEATFCNRELVNLSARLSIIEMIKSGTTTFSDMYYFEDEVAVVAKEIGVRAELTESIIDSPSPTVKTPADGLRYTEEFINNWRHDPLIKIAVSVHAPYTCSADTITKAKALADKYQVGFHLHLSETKQEVQDSLKQHNATPVEYLSKLGVLGGKQVFGIHCVHLTEKDKEILHQNNVGVSYNPKSNTHLASGVAPIHDLLQRGILVSIGTDGAASNNTLNLFKDMDLGAKLQKVFTKDSTALPAHTMIEMATINGAKMLGMDDVTGSIEKNKSADIILINLNLPHLIPMYDAYSHLVYAMNGSEVDTVIVEGKILMQGRELKTINENTVLQEIKQLTQKIKNWKPRYSS